MKKNTIVQIILVLLICLVTVSTVRKEHTQSDIYFSIAVGDRIEKNGFENTDKLVWHEGLRYIYLRWGFDVIVNQIYDFWGLDGIQVFIVTISIFQMLLYYFILNSITKKKIYSFICTLLIIPQMLFELVGRAHLISFSLFLIEYYCIEKLVETNKNKYFIILMIIPLLLVNFHASTYPLYFLFFLPYIAEFILSKMNLKKDIFSKIIIEKRNINKLIILIFIGIFCGFCSPSGAEAYKYVFKVMNAISASFIVEMQPISILDDKLIALSISLFIGIIAFSKTKVRIVDCFLVLGITIMSLNTNRYTFFFYLIASISVFRLLNDFFKDYEINFDFIDLKLKRILAIWGILVIVFASCNKTISNYVHDYTNTLIYPVNASQYILNNIDISKMKLYNHFNFGGYLEFVGIPVFLDARAEMYTKEFNNTSILEDWYKVTSGTESYNKIFDKYDITHALLYNDENINIYMKEDKNWKIVYQDEIFTLYENVQN